MIDLRKTTLAGLATTIIGMDAAVNSAGPALATTSLPNHDGIYTVHVTTRAGDCSHDNKWTILVSGGHVSSAGDTPMEASGRIDSNGMVNLQFRRFGQFAKVTGHVAAGTGSGTWSSPTMQCFGSWQVTKRSMAAK